MVNKITFAMRLKKLREQKRLNQTELANLLKVSNGSISKWERGDRQPDYATLENIADTFNVTIDYLLGRSDSKQEFNESQMNFSTPQEALSFILKQDMVADFGGYDLDICLMMKSWKWQMILLICWRLYLESTNNIN